MMHRCEVCWFVCLQAIMVLKGAHGGAHTVPPPSPTLDVEEEECSGSETHGRTVVVPRHL